MTAAQATAAPLGRSSTGLAVRELAATKPLLSVSLDLDNLWSYMKTHGDAGWERFPSYLDTVCKLVTERLRLHGVTITVFVVGQDAALEKNRQALRSLVEAGHEIGNHSFHHEPWLHLYAPSEVDREIEQAEEHIARATGKRPRGFRGPGFSLSVDVLRVLARRGYLYDASTFPTYLGPLARAYYFWNSRGMPREERAKRALLFGRASEGLRPLKPYRWNLGRGSILEIPVTTMPVFKTPIHLSYLIYLAKFSRLLARAYLETWIGLSRLTGVEPSLLLHPLDFLGADLVKELAFFPGMDLGTQFKLDFFDEVLGRLRRTFTPVTMEGHAAAILSRSQLPERRPATEVIP